MYLNGACNECTIIRDSMGMRLIGYRNNLLYASKISGQVNNEALSKIIYVGEWNDPRRLRDY